MMYQTGSKGSASPSQMRLMLEQAARDRQRQQQGQRIALEDATAPVALGKHLTPASSVLFFWYGHRPD